MGVPPNIGVVKPPKSSILIGFSIINHPFWGTPIFGNIHMTLEPFCLMKIHSFGRVERVFFTPNPFPKKNEQVFLRGKCAEDSCKSYD